MGMDKMEGINLKREDVPDCRCGASSKEINFYGSYSGGNCTHLKDKTLDEVEGWWLRIDHRDEYDLSGDFVRAQDVVGMLLCPSCHKEHNERMREVFQL